PGWPSIRRFWRYARRWIAGPRNGSGSRPCCCSSRSGCCSAVASAGRRRWPKRPCRVAPPRGQPDLRKLGAGRGGAASLRLQQQFVRAAVAALAFAGLLAAALEADLQAQVGARVGELQCLFHADATGHVVLVEVLV